jgi:hypothetical protein
MNWRSASLIIIFTYIFKFSFHNASLSSLLQDARKSIATQLKRKMIYDTTGKLGAFVRFQLNVYFEEYLFKKANDNKFHFQLSFWSKLESTESVWREEGESSTLRRLSNLLKVLVR